MMPKAYKILTVSDVDQTEQDMSFQGGLPNIPDRFDVPRCTYCNMPMTFFFQVAFPKGHVWEDWVMVFFECTSWEHDEGGYEELTEPVYAPGQLHFSDDYLTTYQKKFRSYVFNRSETTHIQSKFSHLLKFARFDFELVDANVINEEICQAGGIPAWEYGHDEDYELYKGITYMGGGVDFLMKLEEDHMFERLPDAPLRHEYLHANKYDSNNPYVKNYDIFNGHSLFFFGSNSPRVNPPQVLLYLG